MAQANPNILPATQSDPLAQLRDIHLPVPIDTGPFQVWPPAPGWWILALLCLVIGLLVFRWAWSRWQANKYRREAVSQLDAILQAWESHGDTTQYLREYQFLLKRVALTRYNRELVASLTGEAWVAFLDKSSRGSEFTMGEGQSLINGNYIEKPSADVHKLHQLGREWIRNHGELPELGVAA